MADTGTVESFHNISANTQRNKHVIIPSKRRFDVIITRLLRCVFAGTTHVTGVII